SDEAAALIERAFRRERFWAGRYEMAKALGACKNDAAFAALGRCLKIADHRSRRGVAEALAGYPRPEAVRILLDLARRDPAYRVRTAALRGLGALKARAGLPVALKALREDSWAELIRRAGVAALAGIEGLRALPRLKGLSSSPHPLPVRLEAIDWLGRLGRGEQGVFEHLEAMLEGTSLREANRRLVFTLVGALESLKDDRSVAALRRLAAETRHGWVKMVVEDAVARIREGLDPEPEKKA
ncbi:MAG: HEAT repeat domain-containing protein, partial [Elusimicrobiota bacterium]